jgi:precorrin-6B methylase 1
LISAYEGPTKGYELVVLAAGDPLFAGSLFGPRVILGVKKVVLRCIPSAELGHPRALS